MTETKILNIEGFPPSGFKYIELDHYIFLRVITSFEEESVFRVFHVDLTVLWLSITIWPIKHNFLANYFLITFLSEYAFWMKNYRNKSVRWKIVELHILYRPKHVWFQIEETECCSLWLVRGDIDSNKILHFKMKKEVTTME